MILRHVNIEPTNHCQLNCSYCSDLKLRPRGYMTLKDFKKIMGMIPHPTEIRLFLSGEPLLHPKIVRMAEIALILGHAVLIHSNGLKMTIKLAKDFIELGKKYPQRLAISFSMHTGRVPECVDALIDMNQNWLIIYLQAIVPYPKPKDIPEFMVGRKCQYYIRWPHNWDMVDLVEDSFHEKYEGVCGFLEDSVAIYWNGDCPICCTDLNGRTYIGNILEMGWNYIEEQIDIHAGMMKDGKDLRSCENCERNPNRKLSHR